jgi:hypothetical protein
MIASSTTYLRSDTIIKSLTTYNIQFASQISGMDEDDEEPKLDNATSSPCYCCDLYIDLSHRTNWKSIEWTLFRRSQAIPTFGNPTRAVIYLTTPCNTDRTTCTLCDAVVRRIRSASHASSRQSVTVNVTYSKEARVSSILFLEYLRPRKYDIHAQFHVYAQASK